MSLRLVALFLLATTFCAARTTPAPKAFPNQLTITILGVRNLRDVMEGKPTSPFIEMMLKRRGTNSAGSDQLWRSFVVREGGLTVTPWPGQQSWSVMYSGEPRLEVDVLSYDLTARDPRKLIGLAVVQFDTLEKREDGSMFYEGELQLKRNGLGGQAGYIDVRIDVTYSDDMFIAAPNGNSSDGADAAQDSGAVASEAVEIPTRGNLRGGQ